jgi:hypothetical protein
LVDEVWQVVWQEGLLAFRLTLMELDVSAVSLADAIALGAEIT